MCRADALRAYASGTPVVVFDEAGVEAPALVIHAEVVTPERMAFLVRHTCGFVTVALPAARCDQLGLPAFAAPSASGRPVAGVSVDSADDVSTGISATDRSHTARLLASPETRFEDLTRPGHLVPVRVYESGGAAAATVAEASLVLSDLAGVSRAAVCCELVRDDGELLTAAEAERFASEHGLAAVALGSLAVLAAA